MPTIPSGTGPADQSSAPVLEQALPEPLPSDPFPLFGQWFAEAHARRVQPNPNAMTLATVDADGRPDARIVLCKAVEPATGSIVFYTNYQGRKGRQLARNPRAAACFHWDLLDRQARLAGPVIPVSEAESDAYFATRPWFSRIGAWTSQQSDPVPSRAALAAQLEQTLRRFGIDPASLPPPSAPVKIPRPPHWGGFRLISERVELWVGGTGRLHDRAEWRRKVQVDPATLQAPSERVTPWLSTRLQP